MGTGQVQIRQHRRRCARKPSVRPVLHQERFDWSGSADHVLDSEDGSVAAGCAIMKMKYVFWLAALLVGYSYLGYPAWLWLRSRWSPRPVRRSSGQGPGRSSAAPALSAIMGVRNQEAGIARKLPNLRALDYPQGKLTVGGCSCRSSDRS